MKNLDIESVVEHNMCQGCGACEYACKSDAIRLRNFTEVGIRPVLDADKCVGCGDCVSVCSGRDLTHDRTHWPMEVIEELTGEWGPVLELWEGHAADEAIWFRGGSGGAATALALYCLEREGMGGALHVGMDPQRPWLNQTVVSRDREELLSRTGSRYAPAAVCAELGAVEESAAPMVMLAKPCDIAAAQKARLIRPKLDANLGLTISIFCGGTPSTRGTLEVLKRLGVEADNVADLRYRGHGWPGMTGVNLKSSTNDDGRVEMTYRGAWDGILTQHKPYRCHVCPDGTGEFADLSCGDPWYRDIQDSEKGSTLIVVRTERGRRMLREAMAAGYLVAEPRDADILPRSQRGLRLRRRTIWPRLLVMGLLGLPRPTYRGFDLWNGWLNLPMSKRLSSLTRASRGLVGLMRRGRWRLRLGDASIGGSEPLGSVLNNGVSPGCQDDRKGCQGCRCKAA
ncbi:MAG: Coenzyme F420 hydrogenase/dehydrogenase, beta subunit C-terminal domain [Planctomycetota bacterium]|jgi:coenzyme F420 hydrogenase subunit beta